MAFAFGLGFVAAPEFLSRMKTKFDAFDGTHLFYGRFIGCNMVVFGITLAFILDTAGAFKATGVWMRRVDDARRALRSHVRLHRHGPGDDARWSRG